MGIGDVLKPTGELFSGALGSLAKYAWVLFIFVGIAIAIAVVFFIRQSKAKKAQWTHTLVIRRVLSNNLLSKPVTHKMRRFPLIKKAEVFELEKPLLGGYLIPELDQYSDVNEFSIILDKNNRIYTNKGAYFDKDKSCVNVSAKHAEIDIQRSNLKADFQNINKITKRIDWTQMAKYVLTTILILAVMVVMIVGIGEWGEAQAAKATSQQAEAAAMESLNEALKSVESAVNTQKLIIPMIQDLYGTKNVQGLINKDEDD